MFSVIVGSDFSCIVPRLGKQPKMQCPTLMVPRVLSCVKIMCFLPKSSMRTIPFLQQRSRNSEKYSIWGHAKGQVHPRGRARSGEDRVEAKER